mmetsp:Transcript_111460/g.315559  ORF Transcript_111460/g.315559 Transcript_111460/m.315559 type:complete len:98 (-) Transcript_111460:526-819(-)
MYAVSPTAPAAGATACTQSTSCCFPHGSIDNGAPMITGVGVVIGDAFIQSRREPAGDLKAWDGVMPFRRLEVWLTLAAVDSESTSVGAADTVMPLSL